MNNSKFTTATFGNMLKTAMIDASIILLMLLLPTISHMTSFPLYKFEPMRVLVLVGYLLSADKKNAYGLALVLPLFSFIISGHPLLIKAFLMIGELTLNVFLFSLLVDKKVWVFFAMLISITVSKLFYYSLKFLLIEFGLMNTNLVDTHVGAQIIISCSIALLFTMLYNHIFKKQ